MFPMCAGPEEPSSSEFGRFYAHGTVIQTNTEYALGWLLFIVGVDA